VQQGWHFYIMGQRSPQLHFGGPSVITGLTAYK